MSIPHSLVMMALGLFRFGVNRAADQSLRSELEFRRASVGRVGRQPALQDVGPGTERIILQGVIHPHFRGG